MLPLLGMMVSENLRDHDRNALAGRNVQEFVWAVRVGMRTEHASDDELRLRELRPEHSHERDGAPFSHIRRRRSEDSLGGACE